MKKDGKISFECRIVATLVTICSMCALADMDSLVVAEGEEMTISQSATYDTVRVNGTLIVSAGTLTATNAFLIADGSGATGTLVVTNSGAIYSSAGTLSVGVNGGSGVVRIHTSSNECHLVELGDGGGSGVIRYDAGGEFNTSCITKKGTGTCRLEFAGGSASFTNSKWFCLDAGQLTLASIDGEDVLLTSTNSTQNASIEIVDGSSGAGTIVTEGAGALVLSLCSWEDISQSCTLDLASRITWGHAGGFVLKGYDNKVFSVVSPDFFCVGGTPAELCMHGGRLDLMGMYVSAKNVLGSGIITNTVNCLGAIVLGLDGDDDTFHGGLEWSANSALCKAGTGTLTYKGDDFSGQLLVSNGVLRMTSAHNAAYLHYRFIVDDCIGTNRDSMQISEFRLLCGDQDVTSLRSGYTFGEKANDSQKNPPYQALDGSLKTKWLAQQTAAIWASAKLKTNCWLQIDFSAPCAISGYDWATADDRGYREYGDHCRDPMKWRLLGSNDGRVWTCLDSQDTGRIFIDRYSWTGPYSVEKTNEVAMGAVELAGGVLEVHGGMVSSDILQTGGDFLIAETGSVGLVDGVWTGPSFAAGSLGPVVSDASRTNIVFCNTASFAGDIDVASGALEFDLPYSVTNRLFRFTIKKTYSQNITQLSRLRLFDRYGNVLSDGLTAASAGTAPASLAAGTCAYSASYNQGGSSAVQHLFDGDTTTKMCLTQLSMQGDPEDNTWRIVHFRLAADVTAPVVSYQLTTANDYTPARNPTVWTLESSSDGVVWTLLDSRGTNDFVNPTAIYTDFNDGVPFRMTSISNTPVELVTLEDGALLSVSAGSSVGSSGTTFSTAGLKVDCTAGAGTISGLAPRADGCIELTNVPDGANLSGYVLPVTIQSLVDSENLKTWTVYVNGVARGGFFVVAFGNDLKLASTGMQILFR